MIPLGRKPLPQGPDAGVWSAGAGSRSRRARRCHVYVRGEPEDEVVAVPLGDIYAVSRAPCRRAM